ncbi:MAG: FG-GAP-like repeat-containing protein [Xanthobacteraceae bacterium]
MSTRKLPYASVMAAGRAAIAATFLFGLTSAASAQSTALSRKAPEMDEILSIAQRDGKVRVIVQFDSPMQASAITADPATLATVKASVAAIQETVIANHFGGTTPSSGPGLERGILRFDITPGFAVNVTGAELEQLAADSRVTSINYDRPMPPTLIQSVPLIGMANAYAAGATGQNFAVAVLDTGTQSNHEFLNGKVIAEACFSNSSGGGGGVSLCPSGASTQTGAGAAQPIGQCLNGAANLCDHGTHVAGIAAGLNTSPSAGEPTNGVGRNAAIFAIQVFTRFNSAAACSPSPAPCIAAFTSDQVAALNHVFANLNLPGGIRVASVNMSLGGGPNTSTPCDGDAQAPAIVNLRNAGVLTAIAAGNDGSRTTISHPACISSALAIGSTTKTDTVSSFSNMANLVHSLAPGGESGGSCTFGANNPGILGPIAVSPPATTSYACFVGTSMATPHTAGAIAAIRTVCPTKTSDEIANALRNTGVNVTDNRVGGSIGKPRIQVDAAVQSLACNAPSPPPPPPVAACTLASYLGDFNGDGRSDLLFRRTDGLISQYLMNGFQFIAINLLGTVGVDFTLVAVADFNGDGNADMLFRRTSDGMLSLYLLAGSQLLGAQLLGAVGVDWDLAGVADFNGDGRADMLFRRRGDGMLSLYLMNGFQMIGAQLLGTVGNDFRVRGVADFNGDGRADILFRRESDGMLSLYLFDGFTNIGAQLLGSTGVDFRLLGVGDFNGDGRADMLFRRPTDGMLSLYLLDGFQLLGAQLLGAIGVDFTLLGLGDLNGDGRTDMLFRRSDGLLIGYLMNGFQLVAAQALGTIGLDWALCYGQPPLSVAQAGGE